MKISFQDIEKRLPGPVRKGLRHVNRWLDKAWWLWGITKRAVSRFVEKEHRVVNSHIDYHRLGAEAYRRMRERPGAAQIDVSDAMREIEQRIERAHHEIDERMEYLDHITVVEPSSSTRRDT